MTDLYLLLSVCDYVVCCSLRLCCNSHPPPPPPRLNNGKLSRGIPQCSVRRIGNYHLQQLVVNTYIIRIDYHHKRLDAYIVISAMTGVASLVLIVVHLIFELVADLNFPLVDCKNLYVTDVPDVLRSGCIFIWFFIIFLITEIVVATCLPTLKSGGVPFSAFPKESKRKLASLFSHNFFNS